MKGGERLLSSFYVAFEAVFANRVRSILTALGIIFGVAAVIAMLAIGNGAQQEILEQIKLVGVNNIIVSPIVEQKEEALGEDADDLQDKNKYSPGLSLLDVEAIKEILPDIQRVSPEVILDTYIINNGLRRSAKLVGVSPDYFGVTNFELAEGVMFTDEHLKKGMTVCIIGKSIKTKFFPTENPVGKKIKCGNNWMTIIGVLKERYISESSIAKLGIRDYNMDVYVPLKTILVRYRNRDLLTRAMVQQANRGTNMNSRFQINSSDEPTLNVSDNYHQIDRLVIQVEETDQLNPSADVISRMLERRHYGVIDFQIEIPELLLKQQQRTNDIFNYVLGAIAGISLIVGGIGIMNIMLASVLERIKEIGLRIALGAKRSDVVNQFLFEAVLISVSGGIIGVVLGVGLAWGVSEMANIPTIVSASSIFISFGVAATIGLVFGIAPAQKAAKQDPITSLRHD